MATAQDRRPSLANIQLSSISPQQRKGKKHDFFFSHNWQSDEKGRDNHQRVKQIAARVKQLGFTAWLDEDELRHAATATSLHTALTDAIDDSTFFVICLTRVYARKVREGAGLGADSCQLEFNYALTRKEGRAILVLVMEEACQDLASIRGPVGAVASSKLYFDCAADSDACFDACAAALGAAFFDLVPSGCSVDGSRVPRRSSSLEYLPEINPAASVRVCRAAVGDLVCVQRPDGQVRVHTHKIYGNITPGEAHTRLMTRIADLQVIQLTGTCRASAGLVRLPGTLSRGPSSS